jgi:hypothetical protein
MSGFVTSTFQYPSLGPPTSAAPGGSAGCGGAKKSNVLMMPRTNPGMGDLTTIGSDLSDSLSSGDFTAVINDLMPWASASNMLFYVAGIGLWWFMGRGGSDEANREARAEALKTLNLEFQLKQQAIDKKYPVKKKSRKKGGLAGLLGG